MVSIFWGVGGEIDLCCNERLLGFGGIPSEKLQLRLILVHFDLPLSIQFQSCCWVGRGCWGMDLGRDIPGNLSISVGLAKVNLAYNRAAFTRL